MTQLEHPNRSVPISAALEILLEDEALLALNKPAGLATQAPAEFDSLQRRVQSRLAAGAPPRSRLYLGVPHRLDRPVSGAIVMAKTRRAARNLSKQFQRRRVRKVYWAVVEGAVVPDSGTWTNWMRKVAGQPRAEIVASDAEQSQQAVLHYRVVRRLGAGTLLEIELETGRMHQIRLQAASRGHPILGDLLYGSRQRFGPRADDPRQQCIALHARQLELLHPTDRQPRTITAPLPPAWAEHGCDSADGAL
jgi:23S rRNA pseudouridine1911/1915/1917 synthase